jgi:hypothetical protein
MFTTARPFRARQGGAFLYGFQRFSVTKQASLPVATVTTLPGATG